jgi:hypothetical protein
MRLFILSLLAATLIGCGTHRTTVVDEEHDSSIVVDLGTSGHHIDIYVDGELVVDGQRARSFRITGLEPGQRTIRVSSDDWRRTSPVNHSETITLAQGSHETIDVPMPSYSPQYYGVQALMIIGTTALALIITN